MQKKPTETGTFDKVWNKLRSIANGLTGGARSAVDSASTTAKSAVESASHAAASAGAAIKENPGKTAAVAGAVIATAAAAVAGKKVYDRKAASSVKPAAKKPAAKKPAAKKPPAKKPATKTVAKPAAAPATPAKPATRAKPAVKKLCPPSQRLKQLPNFADIHSPAQYRRGRVSYQPFFAPLFCVFSHFIRGAKYSSIGLPDISRVPVNA